MGRQATAEYLYLCRMVDLAVRTGRGGALLRAVADLRPDLWRDARDYAVGMALEIIEDNANGGAA